MRRAAAIGASIALLLAGPAGAMPVATFLAKADALRAKGMMALFSSDIGVLKGEFSNATKAWRAQIAPPGHKPNACPPAGPLKIGSDEILTMLRAVPPQARATTSVSDAVTQGLNRKYSCRG